MTKRQTLSENLAYHLCKTKVTKTKPVPGDGSGALLPRKLVISPGTYRVHGSTYRMEREGLYRFFLTGKGNEQRIVYKDDTLALASGLCWMHSHGTRDEGRSFQETIKTGMREKLILTYGPYTAFVSELYTQLGIRHRIVSMKTLERPNSWNDGHVTMEVFIRNKWVIVDHDPHTMYRYRGKYLSLLEMIPHVKADDYEMVPLAASYDLAVSDFKCPRSGYDYGLLMETMAGGRPRAEGLREGLRRVMMLPVIGDSGDLYTTTTTDADDRKFEKRKKQPYWQNLTWLPVEEFREKFYGA